MFHQHLPRIVALCCLLPLALSLPSHPSTWATLAPIPIAARQEQTTFFLPPSTIGIVGGVVPSEFLANTTNIMQFYSIPHNTWQTMPPLPRPLNHVNVAVNGGKIYALGGLADAADGSPAWEAVSDSWVYDPRKKIWTSIAPVPEDEKRGSAGMGVYKDLIILAGGMRVLELAGDQLQDTVDIVSIYDTAKGTWLAVPAAAKHLPEGRDHAGAAVIGDKFYILGGRNHGQHNVKDTVFILDLCNISAGWKTSKAKMPTPRGGLAAGVIGTKVYTFGGEGNVEVASGVYNETEVYDSVRDEWRKLAPMKIPRHGTSAVGVGGRVFIPGGGVLIGAGPVSDFDVFMP